MSITSFQSKSNLEQQQQQLQEDSHQHQEATHQQQQQQFQVIHNQAAQSEPNQQPKKPRSTTLTSTATLTRTTTTPPTTNTTTKTIPTTAKQTKSGTACLNRESSPVQLSASTTAAAAAAPTAKTIATSRSAAESSIKQLPPTTTSPLTPSAVKFSNSTAPVAATLPNGLTTPLQHPPQLKQPQQPQSQANLPQAALLKIKPFVPSLNTRLRRPISRSYSTLSTTANQKRTTSVIVNPIFTRFEARSIVNGISSPQSLSANTNCFGAANVASDGNAAIGNGGLVVGATAIDTSLEKSAARPTAPLRRQPIKVVTRQRSKSTSSSASNSNRAATAALANGNGTPTAPYPSKDANATSNTTGTGPGNVSSASNSSSGMTVVAQPNGICRITRHAREQEKLPDRINYDRRGLTAIPIFENESNLRLLSLQHNLINIFHIPNEKPSRLEEDRGGYSEVPRGSGSGTGNFPSTMAASNGNEPAASNRTGRNNSKRLPLNLITSPNANYDNNTVIVKNNLLLTSPNQNQHQNQAQALTQIQNQPQIQMQPQPAPLSTQSLGLLGSTSTTIQVSHLSKRSSILQNINYNSQHKQQQQQQVKPPHYRFPVKKSKSFITNYTRHFNNLKRNIQRPLLSKADSKMMSLMGSANLKSFDSGGSGITNTDSLSTLMNNDVEEEEDSNSLQLLEIKNRQLQSSYGLIFQNLVFLDLYDNQIERISNLDGLPMLSVLLLGKNRITDITGLASLRETLRVLDLHGNKITSISNKINCLRELKSLNLAGNQIRQINQNDFNGLLNLKELNLKRNRIRRINGFQHLSALERLWLCHNDLHKVEDMSSIAKAVGLQEVTIENNPVSLAGDCVSFLVSYLPNLQSLSQMPITEQVRRAANAWRKNKELSESNASQYSSEVFNSIRREEVISNARTNWELLRSQQTVQVTLNSHRSPKQRELEKINESNEAVVSYEELQEYIKLPPIQQHSKQKAHRQGQLGARQERGKPENAQDSARHSGSSGSSLGPNVDSSSSCYSSENEDSDKKKIPNGKPGKHRKNAYRSSRKPMASTPRNRHIVCAVDDTRKKSGADCTKLESTSSGLDKNANHDSNDSTTSPLGTAMAMETNVVHSASNQSTLLLTTTSSNGRVTPTLTSLSNQQLNLSSHTQASSRATTPTKAISPISELTSFSASNAIVYLGYQQQNGCRISPSPSPARVPSPIPLSVAQQTILQHNAPPAATMLPISANPACRRYMRSSLMRSQTIGGSSSAFGNNSSGALKKTKGSMKTHANFPPASQQQQQVMNQANGTSNPQSSCSITSIAATSISSTSTWSTAKATAGNHISGTTSSTNPPNANGENAPGPLAATAITVTTETIDLTATITNIETTSTDSCNAAVHPTATAASPTTDPTPITASTASSAAQQSAAGQQQPTKATAAEREREQGGDYLIEICGRYLNIYGQGALRFIDKQWNPAKANDVHTLNFSYINFNNITSVLARIKVRFPHAENFVFRETNISCLGQLNALAELQGIASLFIDPEGNPITTKDLWRHYAIYRLSHWGLKLLNGVEVAEAEVDEANVVYAGLSDLVLWSMPNVMLQPLLARLRLDETCTASKMSPKEWLMKPDNNSLRLVVGKEALQWKKPSNSNNAAGGMGREACAGTLGLAGNIYGQQQQQHHLYLNCHQQQINETALSNGNASTATTAAASANALTIRERGKLHFTAMMENTCNAIEKLHKLETLWPSLLLDIIRNTLLDYAQLDTYLRNLMSELTK